MQFTKSVMFKKNPSGKKKLFTVFVSKKNVLKFEIDFNNFSTIT